MFAVTFIPVIHGTRSSEHLGCLPPGPMLWHSTNKSSDLSAQHHLASHLHNPSDIKSPLGLDGASLIYCQVFLRKAMGPWRVPSGVRLVAKVCFLHVHIPNYVGSRVWPLLLLFQKLHSIHGQPPICRARVTKAKVPSGC